MRNSSMPMGRKHTTASVMCVRMNVPALFDIPKASPPKKVKVEPEAQ
jgi:hypothetical protein